MNNLLFHIGLDTFSKQKYPNLVDNMESHHHRFPPNREIDDMEGWKRIKYIDWTLSVD